MYLDGMYAMAGSGGGTWEDTASPRDPSTVVQASSPMWIQSCAGSYTGRLLNAAIGSYGGGEADFQENMREKRDGCGDGGGTAVAADINVATFSWV